MKSSTTRLRWFRRRAARSRVTTASLVMIAMMAASCGSNRAVTTELRWSEEDAGPVANQEGVAIVATADGLLAWGGIDGEREVDANGWSLRSDGEWSPLPSSPLSPRHHAAAAWTGDAFVVIGGSSDANVNGVGDLRDGATYTPSTKRWRPIATIPDDVVGQIDRRCRDDTVDAAGLVIVPCLTPGAATVDATGDTTIRTVAAYRPTDDTWTSVAVFVGTDGAPQAWFAVGDRLGVVSIGPRPAVSGVSRAELTVSLAGKAAGSGGGAAPAPSEPQSTIELSGVATGPDGTPVAGVGGAATRSSIVSVALGRSFLSRTDERGSVPGPELRGTVENAPLAGRVDVVTLSGAPPIVVGTSLATVGGSGIERPPGVEADGWGHWRPVDNGRQMWLVTEPSPSPDGTVGVHRLWRLDAITSR